MSDKNHDKIVDGEYSPNIEFDKFWIAFAVTTLQNTLDGLDERAKYLITTSATLIAVNFGLLLVFSSEFSFKVAPQFFFAISTIFFVYSYFPTRRTLSLEDPQSNKTAFDSWRDFKLRWHRWGFAFFIIGLIAMGVTSVIDPITFPSNGVIDNVDDNIQTNGTTLEVRGNLTLHPR